MHSQDVRAENPKFKTLQHTKISMPVQCKY